MYNDQFIKQLYSEIFVVDLNNDEPERNVPAKIYSDFFDVIEDLNSIDNKGIKIMHGHLLPATVIPSKFNGVNVFVIVNFSDQHYGFVAESESDTPEELAMVIELIINNSQMLAPREIRIEDVFLLYGARIKTTLSVTEDELDEEFIERSGTIADEVHDIMQKNNDLENIV